MIYDPIRVFEAKRLLIYLTRNIADRRESASQSPYFYIIKLHFCLPLITLSKKANCAMTVSTIRKLIIALIIDANFYILPASNYLDDKSLIGNIRDITPVMYEGSSA